eukprot:TRINITY_DN11557_c0_g1_i3.p1 TRINITY_DN11557_c0_g1~~TRINITY_DN11557_c0_g1_i3.p1  ORF type:complete len:813 (+),score=167.06 TRINITY_DN11557_c0_g1_i3:109-2439(+)
MIAPMLLSSMHFIEDCFKEPFRSLKCGKAQIVIQQYDALCFLLASDEGEPESLLRSKLHLAYHLLLLIFGPQALQSKTRPIQARNHAKNLHRIMHTMFQLAEDSQSILVQSIERLEVNDAIRKLCTAALKSAITPIAEATHALIYVGTKLLVWHFKQKAFPMTSTDMFLLVLYFRSRFHATVREVKVKEVPVADYTDHEAVINQVRAGVGNELRALAQQDTSRQEDDAEGATSIDEGFDTAPEEFDAQGDSYDDDYVVLETTYSGEEEMGGFRPEIFVLDPALDDIASVKVGELVDGSAPDTSDMRIDAILLPLQKGLAQGAQGNAVAFVQYCLAECDAGKGKGVLPAEASGIYEAHTATAVAKFLATLGRPETDGSRLSPADIQALATQTRSQLSSRAPSTPTSPSKSTRVHTSGEVARRLAFGDRRGRGAGNDAVPSLDIGAISLSDTEASDTGANAPTETDVTPSSSSSATPAGSEPSSSATTPRGPSTPGAAAGLGAAGITPGPAGMGMGMGMGMGAFSPFGSSAPSVPHVPPPSTFDQLYLRTPPYLPMWVYCAEVQESTTLVIINKGMTGTAEEKAKLDKIQDSLRDWLNKNYANYLVAKEKAHLPILQYLHMLPGLVHYIFVDRTANRVQAPTITPLHGQQYRDSASTQRMLTLLKGRVWDMYYHAHRHLAMGYTSMVMRSGDFQYSYRLWVEDDEGAEQPLDLPRSQYPATPQSHKFYKDLLRAQYPSQLPQMKCYELYTLYLGILPAALVSKNDKALVALLLEGDVD